MSESTLFCVIVFLVGCLINFLLGMLNVRVSQGQCYVVDETDDEGIVLHHDGSKLILNHRTEGVFYVISTTILLGVSIVLYLLKVFPLVVARLGGHFGSWVMAISFTIVLYAVGALVLVASKLLGEKIMVELIRFRFFHTHQSRDKHE